MVNKLKNSTEEGGWKPVRERVILGMNHQVLRNNLIKELRERQATAAMMQVIHVNEKDPNLYSVYGEGFMLEVKSFNSVPPDIDIVKGEHIGKLFPEHAFEDWWRKAYPGTPFTPYYNLLLHRVKVEQPRRRAEQAQEQEPRTPEIEPSSPQEAEPVQAPPQREPDALPADAITFRDVHDLRKRVMKEMEKFRERLGGKAEATLNIGLDDGSLIPVRVERPGGRVLVVWAHPEAGTKFSLVGGPVEQKIADLAGGKRISRIFLTSRSSE